MNGETIYIIGGTAEANRAARRLEDEGFRVAMSVATSLGGEHAASSVTDVGARDAAGIAASAASSGASAIVDCSHPFAEAVSREAAGAACMTDVPYIRFTRAGHLPEAPNVKTAAGWNEAVVQLQERKQRVLLTIGVRQLHLFTEAGLDLAARVLPQRQSLERCRELGLDPADIIAAEPPHSVDFNRRCIRRSRAELVVSKDSGREGGLPEKVEAAAAEGMDILVISRPPEPGALTDITQLVEALRQGIRQQAGKNDGVCHPGR